MLASKSFSNVKLADHVRACRVDDHLILLDLRLNKYIGLGGSQLPALCEAIFGKKEADGTQSASSNCGGLDKWISKLRNQNLLSDRAAIESMRRPSELTEPTIGLTIDDGEPAAGTEWRHLFRLWQATFAASTWLRRYSLEDISNRVARLRARYSGRGNKLGEDAICLASARFLRLRPFALSSYDRCLNDSLTLVHFLATQGLFPHWVIGVRVHPFGAHSWVQSGEVVLNDLPERVRRYKPILVV